MYEKSISWLCEKGNPSTRYYAMRDLLRIPEAQEERKYIEDSRIVKKILKTQSQEGWWAKKDASCWDKNGTCWQLVFLSELGVPANTHIRKACEHMFSYQRRSGAFSASFPKTKKAAENPTKSDSCLTGKVLGFLIDFGYERDPRTQRTIRWLLDNQEKDGLFPCSYFHPNPKTAVQNCYMGITKPLAALVRIPSESRTERIKEFMRRTVRTMLSMDVFMYRIKDGERIAKRSWTRFCFPHLWTSDALDAMFVLAKAGAGEEKGTERARRLIASKEGRGRWILEGAPKGWDWEEMGKPSKWITLRALEVLMTRKKNL
jgi:hypothetical protein